MEILKVSSSSNPNSVAGALAGVIRDNACAEVQAIGAGHCPRLCRPRRVRSYLCAGFYGNRDQRQRKNRYKTDRQDRVKAEVECHFYSVNYFLNITKRKCQSFI